jgi:hypothetical protein
MGKHKGGGGPSSPTQREQNGASFSAAFASEKAGRDQVKPGRATPSLKQRIWAKVEASLWVLGAVFALTYGDGHHSLPHVLLYNKRLKR